MFQLSNSPNFWRSNPKVLEFVKFILHHDLVEVAVRDDQVPEVQRLQVGGPLNQGFPVVRCHVEVPKFAMLQLLKSGQCENFFLSSLTLTLFFFGLFVIQISNYNSYSRITLDSF